MGLLAAAVVLLALTGLPLLSRHWGCTLLAYLGWGPAAPALTWLNPGAWAPLILTLLACPVAVFQALVWDGSLAREELLFRGKLAQIRRGRLSYSAQWGWVDRRHRLADVLAQLTPGRHQLVHLFFGSLGSGYELVANCSIQDPRQSWRVVQLMGERCEAEEARLPWWTGAWLSAYNSDDLPSIYFTLFQAAHPQKVFHFETPAHAEQRWWAEGRHQVGRRIHGWKGFRPGRPDPLYTAFFAELEKVDTDLEMSVRGPVGL